MTDTAGCNKLKEFATPGWRISLRTYSWQYETTATRYDVAIIGGGPAGSSAGVFCSRAGLDTVVVADDRSLSTQRLLAASWSGSDSLDELGVEREPEPNGGDASSGRWSICRRYSSVKQPSSFPKALLPTASAGRPQSA